MSSENMPTDHSATVQECREVCARIRKELSKVIVGRDQLIEQVLIAVLARGHAIVEGVPGLARTLLLRSLAEAADLKFKRIAFTPDLTPGDLTGTGTAGKRTMSRIEAGRRIRKERLRFPVKRFDRPG